MTKSLHPDPSPSDAAHSGTSIDGVPAEALPSVLELLGRIGDALVATLGPTTEVVVHDLRHPEQSIVAISGELTGRHVGAPVPDPELLPEALERFTTDDLCRSTTTQTGHELTSSTVWVRDENGRIVGGMCINVDSSGLRLARDLIDRQLGVAGQEPARAESRPLPTFAQDVRELIRLAVQETVDQSGKPRHQFSLADRTAVVRRLDQGGLLELRGSVGILADELGVSRATVYAYLKKSRAKLDPEHAGGPLLALVLGSKQDADPSDADDTTSSPGQAPASRRADASTSP
jgi:predicted transcriptional regulator YheO